MARTPYVDRQQIVVARHPNKRKDGIAGITPFGASQTFAATQALRDQHGFDRFDRFFFSGAKRALEASMVTAAALGQRKVSITNMPSFHFKYAVERFFGGDMTACGAEESRIVAAGGKVKNALEVSAYARQGREIVGEGVLVIAAELRDLKRHRGHVTSHSGWSELAVLDTSTMPFLMGEADAIIYTIESGVLVSSEHIVAPKLQ